MFPLPPQNPWTGIFSPSSSSSSSPISISRHPFPWKMAGLIPETAKKIFTPETLRAAAKQSDRCLVVPVGLRRAIKRYLRDLEEPHLKKKVVRLSQSFSHIKEVNSMLTTTTGKDLVNDPFKSLERTKRWKIKSDYGDIGITYADNETPAYVASRMPAVFSACYRVLSEVSRRLPGFSPATLLDFGAGTGSAFWAMREVWPKSVQKVNIVEPSQSMQRAGRSLIQGLRDLPVINGYSSIQALAQHISKSERKHDLVIASYVLGEIPSLQDRLTIVRQLWDLTGDVLVLIEPGTPQGSTIISQMRSHILWMEQRKLRKAKVPKDGSGKDLVSVKSGAFVVAPCPHDGRCPLENSSKYCHFVQRLQRTSVQCAYKRSRGESLRGFEDEKFSFVAFRRGQRPREPWPLDGMALETLEEQRAKRNAEDLVINYEEDLFEEETAQDTAPSEDAQSQDVISVEEVNAVKYESDADETVIISDKDDDEEKQHGTTGCADVGGGWGRIIFPPVQRGRRVTMDVCRSINRDGSEGTFEHIVVSKSDDHGLTRAEEIVPRAFEFTKDPSVP